MMRIIQTLAWVLVMMVSYSVQGQNVEGGDNTLSPYFFIKSEDASIDQMPLKSTRADVNIAGMIADVKVTQVYKNDGRSPLEALYIFPASTRAAVHHMRMTIGERSIEAVVKTREKARQEYQQAVEQGKSASLLEQQRPNVFQMNVGNIMPGDEIRVELEYTEMLIPENGVYEFVYPTVVGPRYSNQNSRATASRDEKWVSNPYTRQGVKPLYTFDITCNLVAGMPVSDVKCSSHETDINFTGSDKATISLKKGDAHQGNKDFVLNYRLSGNQVNSGILLYPGKDENFFLAMIQPQKRPKSSQIPPREYVFIVDVSGSMNGFPLDISKKLINNLLGKLRPEDQFNILTFAGNSAVLSEKSLPATAVNIQSGKDFLNRQQGGGGTELLPALKKALNLGESEGMARTFVIATDGYVTVEKEAFDLIRNNLNKANFFAFGIGTAVNRYLIEGMAHAGMGLPFVVTKPEEAEAQEAKFCHYIENPVLTDIKVTYNGFQVYDVEPLSVPDVFSDRPVIVFGKYRGNAGGSISVSGTTGEGRYEETISLASADKSSANMALRYLWARERIRYIDDFGANGNGGQHNLNSEAAEEVTRLGLKYNLLTQYTSFVAIDSEVRNTKGGTTKVTQPLPLPEGVSDLAIGSTSAGVRKMPANSQYSSPTTSFSAPEEKAEKDYSGSEPRTRGKQLQSKKPAESERVTNTSDSIVFTTVEEMAAFPGGEEKLRAYLKANLNYPKFARMEGIHGTVYISFSIKKDGTIYKVKVVRGIGGGCDEEALRVVKNMPKWIPGKQAGKPVETQMTLPIKFVL